MTSIEEENAAAAATGFEIAVTGMSGRFPGAKDIDEFWDNLKNGVESISFFTNEELESSAGTGTPNFVPCKGGVLENKDHFDALFFGFTPREAEIMDPQLRILHEVVWTALEHAGYNPDSYTRPIGFYAGAATNFYWELRAFLSEKGRDLGRMALLQSVDRGCFTTRISYLFNLKGPSMTIQTACSTSLVAVHQACRALLGGECSIALAGGVTINAAPAAGYFYQEGMIASPDGHCRAFDALGKGTVSGEGAAIVVLKTLEDALADRDTIHAIIKSSAVNNDGVQKMGYSAPSVEGQAAAVRTALLTAEVPPESISYVETHGTGTELGDPVEIEALKLAFNTSKNQYCALGAVKTNIGHLDAAAGVTGLIKTILALKHKQIPPTLHFKNPNPKIDFENSPFYVNTELRAWQHPPYPLRAGVSSFGIGGTNAHVILEEAPGQISENNCQKPCQLILLSAKTGSALARQAKNLAVYFTQHPGTNIADAAYTLQVGRKAFAHREMLVCHTGAGAEIVNALSAPDAPDARKVLTARVEDKNRPVVFMFPGLGAEYVNMGAGLYQYEPFFKKEMDRCCEIFKSLSNFDIRSILYPSPGDNNNNKPNLNDPQMTQPVIFCFEYALARLLMNLGIKPQAMIGYSFGEYTAACIAGVLDLEEALALIAARSRLIGTLPPGMMTSVPMTKEESAPLLSGRVDLSIAVDNGPSCVVSGHATAVAAFEQEMKTQRCICTRISTVQGIHSPLMDPVLKDFEKIVGRFHLKEPQIPYISNVTGQWITRAQAVDPSYWVNHMRHMVRFSDGLKELLKMENALFIEVGPVRDLCALVVRHIDENPWSKTLQLVRHPGQDEPDVSFFTKRLGRLWLLGIDIDWLQYHVNEQRCRIPLPTYPFEGKRYWIDDINGAQDLWLLQSYNGIRGIVTNKNDSPNDRGKEILETVSPTSREQRPVLSTPYEAPANETEKALVRTWEDFFGIPGIGVHDDFFELGGDSLKAAAVIAVIHKKMNARLQMSQLFDAPTIRKLSGYINREATEEFVSLEPVETREYYPLSSAQERVYILQQMDIDSTAYNLPTILELAGDPDTGKLQETFKKLILRHESLRTSFHMIGENLFQVVHVPGHIEFSIRYQDISSIDDSFALIPQKIGQFIRPFNLALAPLFRVELIKVKERKYIFLIDIHHIIGDGVSLLTLIKEFMGLYGGAEFPPLRIQYKDYTGYLYSKQTQEKLQHQAAYWLRKHREAPPVLPLPSDYPRPAVQDFAGTVYRFEIGNEELKDLKQLARLENMTLYMLLLAAYSILLCRLNGQENIVIGAPIAGRRHVDLSAIIGMFVNTLAFRFYPAGNKSIKQFLAELKQETLEGFENQEYPFEELVEQVVVNRDPGRHPLFDAAFILQNLEFPALEIPGIALKSYPHDKKIVKFDFLLQIFEAEGEKLIGALEYSTRLFEPGTIERFTGYFKRILAAVSADTGKQIAGIDILSDSEKKQLLIDFNDTAVDYPREQTIQQLLAEQVVQAPDAIAVFSHGQTRTNTDKQVTYFYLNEQAGHLAGLLIEKGVMPGDIVGIMLERSAELIIGILGILKAGGAYLPVDPEYPQERIDYILKDSKTKILIINKSEIRNPKFETNPNDQNANVQNENKKCHEAFVLNFENLNFEFVSGFVLRASNFNSLNLAYIMYTSGSTGKPKGVVVTHRNVVRLVKNTNFVPLSKETRILQTGAPVFDATTFEIWGSLLNGGQLVLVNKEVILDAFQLKLALIRQSINTLWLSAPLFNQLLQQDNELFVALRYLLVGGDVLSPGHINQARRRSPNLEIINGYGPTENTTFSLTYTIEKEFEQNIPVGRPIANSTAYIFDKWMHIVPPGVAGELFVGGDGVALGYLNNPELTKQKFLEVQEPFFKKVPGPRREKIYCTGDLVRWLLNGNIEFLGRIDQQVKIRGFRVELGEIENRLAAHSIVKQATVLVLDNENDKLLCAYIVLKTSTEDETIAREELKKYLETVLPDYMVPAFFVFLDRVPLTLNGKIDRQALPKPDIGSQNQNYVPPRDEMETKMAGIWAEVLNLNPGIIGIDDNFFHLGGHSLKATLMAAKIQKTLAVKIPLAQLFKNSTIRTLTEYIKQEAGPSEGVYKAVEPAEKKEYYQLSSAQERLFFLQQMDPQGTGYNIPIALTLQGNIDNERIKETLNILIQRHESFRTSFHMIDGKTVQKIQQKVEFEIVKESCLEKFNGSFDLSVAPLLRVGLKKITVDNHILMLNMHHIISDGTSTMILAREFMDLYAGKVIPFLPIQYKDYALWQTTEKETFRGQANFWTAEFSGEIPVLQLPLDYPRPEVQSFAGSRIVFETGTNELEKLHRLVLEPEITATLYMALLSVYGVLLSKVSGQEELVIGAPIANRRHPDLASIIGMFVNTLALRVFPDGEKTFKTFLKEIKSKTLSAFENQEYPFEELVENVAVNRDASRNPLFDAAFILQNIDFPTLEIPGLTLKPYPYDYQIAKFDLLLQASELEGKQLVIVLEYCTKLFKQETMERFAGYFKRILSAILENPDQKIAGIEILSESEKKQLLIDFNDTTADYPRDKTIHELFAEQVAQAPDAIVLVARETREIREKYEKQVTYFYLNEQAGHLAQSLIEKGVLPDNIVGIMMERSIELIIGIMGILKAGGAYLPIDPGYPQERIDYMLKDSNAKIVVDYEFLKEAPQAPFLQHSAFSIQHSNHLCYIIYTSGSTGKPKGVIIEHRGLVNLCHWHIGYYGLTNRDHVSQYASCGFDASVWEIFPALTVGASLYIIANEMRLDMELLNAFFEKHDITISFLPTPACRQFMNLKQENRSLRIMLTGGDKLQGYIKQNYRLYNNYGPTENTVVTTAYQLDDDCENIPVGKPIANTQVYIMGKNGSQLQPVGTAGELCISGNGLSRGYLNNPELTAERFNRSYWSHTTYIFYKTGDRARWLPDGNIEFLGRIDQQVKIRGFRVELGEIENRLAGHAMVKQAVVLVLDNENDKLLCAYIVLKPGTNDETIARTELKKYLETVLPDYMVPSFFVFLDRIPLTLNGKIDRQALPKPGIGNQNQNYVPPRDEMETKMAGIWAEVLNLNPGIIGIDDNFFQLGGHSLKATLMAGKIQKTLAVKIPLAQLFKNSTIRTLTEYIKQEAGQSGGVYNAVEPVEKKEYYALSSAQERLFFLQQMDPQGTGYNIPIVLTLQGNIDNDRIKETFKILIQRHESFRTSFHMIEGKTVQQIQPEVAFEIVIEPSLENFNGPFDLSVAPLLRVCLKKITEDNHILMLNMHHIISDGTSTMILAREFMDLYAGKVIPLLPIQYKDYALWQTTEKETFRGQANFWVQEFTGEIPVLQLPLDFPRPDVQSFAGSRIAFETGTNELETLHRLVQEPEITATLYMALLSVYAVLLAKVSGQEELVIGAPIANRRHPDLSSIIGMFVNTLALRVFPDGDKTFKTFLKEIKTKTLSAFENQEYPFEELVQNVAVNRDASRNPLFDAAFILQNIDFPTLEIPGLTLKPYPYDYQIAKFDLLLQASELEGKQLVIVFEYCTKLFKQETMERFTGYFKRILSAIIKNPEQKISGIEILSESEKKQLLIDFNDTAVDYPRDKTIHELFAEQVAQTPDAIAVFSHGQTFTTRTDTDNVGADLCVCPNSNYPVNLSYHELNDQSDRLAGVLIEKGVLPDDIVGIMMERSSELIIGILGILKSGGAYLPIDPEYPQERIDYMLKDSGTRILITNDENKKMDNCQCSIVNCQLSTGESRTSFQHSSFSTQHSNHLCYIIYTSGSTGKPKGVMIEHRHFVNLAFSQIKQFAIDEKEHILQFSSICFDASVEQIFIALFSGAALYLFSKNTLLDNTKFAELIASQLITHIHAVPSFLDTISLKEGHHVKRVISGGDVCPPGLAEKFSTHCDFYNKYGPTETTVTSLEMRCRDIDKTLSYLPVGKPIANTFVYILDQWFKPVPLGTAGELYIGGDGVARGYLNNPELTNNKFKHDLWDYQTPLVYKTGDLCKWLADGNIQFLGRIDRQVKIRGFRIELGEIESRLLKHKHIKAVAINAKTDTYGDKYLAAYYVSDSEIPAPNLREYLLKDLPDYMVPAYFIHLEKLPLLTNGKLDWKALPEPALIGKAGDSTPPRDTTDQLLIEIWAEILQVEKETLGIDTNFFAAGGHSLKATTVANAIQKTFHVKFTLAEIFNQPTIRRLAHLVKEKKEEKYLVIRPAAAKPYYDVSSAQKRLYIHQQLNPDSITYNIPIAVQLEGNLDPQILEQVFRKIIYRHESLRTGFEIKEQQPVQVIYEQFDFQVTYAETPAALENFIQPFDLSRPPLLRVLLVKAAERKYILVVDIHHIVTDGLSNRLIAREFMALCAGQELPPLKLRFRDFSEWQNKLLSGTEIKKQAEYWLQRFSGTIPQLNLPLDFPRPDVHNTQSDSVIFEINPEETTRLKKITAETGATSYMILLAVYTILISRYADQVDIIIATGIAGRRHIDLQNIVGMFVNMLAIRLNIPEEMSFNEFLNLVRQHAVDAFDNQDFQFDELVKQLGIETHPNRNPLFDTQFTFLDAGPKDDTLEIPGLTLTPYPFSHNKQPFDLDLNAAESGSGIVLSLNYQVALFKRTTIENMAGHFKEILSQCLENRETRLKDINLSVKLVSASAELDHEEVSGFEF